jgi:phosphatidylinositol alpha 1,6-mannosyltransferase
LSRSRPRDEVAGAGLALLAAPVSGVEELVDDGRSGWLVARDAAAIAERLRALGADPQLRAALGRAAREASARYTWDAMVDGYVKLYEGLDDAAEVAVPAPARTTARQ